MPHPSLSDLEPENDVSSDAPFDLAHSDAPQIELSVEDATLHSDSRPATAFSRRALLGFGALVGAALALPALPARADLGYSFGYSDLKALRALEELSRLEADFFAKTAISAPIDGLPEREMSAFYLIARQDSELMRWFGAARDRYGIRAFDDFTSLNQAASRPMPEYHFGASTSGTRAELFTRALEVKSIAVSAFHGAVGAARDPKLVQAFAALAGVQGRHLAMLQELNGKTPFVAFESAMSLRDAATKLARYGFNAEALT